MDGLTNIIAKINEQTDIECSNIIELAKEKADEIIARANDDAKKICDDISAQTDAKLSVINSKAVSSSELAYKREILKHKSIILSNVLEKAKNDILSMKDEEYFDLIVKLARGSALCGKGVMKLSERDLNRVPDGFVQKLSEALGEGYEITLSNEACAIDGGFVIEYDEMKVDCSISSLINDKIDAIRDSLSSVLF